MEICKKLRKICKILHSDPSSLLYYLEYIFVSHDDHTRTLVAQLARQRKHQKNAHLLISTHITIYPNKSIIYISRQFHNFSRTPLFIKAFLTTNNIISKQTMCSLFQQIRIYTMILFIK